MVVAWAAAGFHKPQPPIKPKRRLIRGANLQKNLDDLS
jgi:hypothetical protein